MIKYNERVCEICGKVFVPIQSNQLYCSISCRKKAPRIKEIRNKIAEEEKAKKRQMLYDMVKNSVEYGKIQMRETLELLGEKNGLQKHKH